MRQVTAFIFSIALGFASFLPAAAQEEGTCAHPILVGGGGGSVQIALDTRLYANHQEPDSACSGLTLTGPDVVLGFGGAAIDGQVTWTADFNAILYWTQGECDFSSCVDTSTTGTLQYYCNYEPISSGHPATWKTPYIAVDGIDGAAGIITLTFTYGVNVPALPQTWGRLKSTCR
jgi:hypothetical protein